MQERTDIKQRLAKCSKTVVDLSRALGEARSTTSSYVNGYVEEKNVARESEIERILGEWENETKTTRQ